MIDGRTHRTRKFMRTLDRQSRRDRGNFLGQRRSGADGSGRHRFGRGRRAPAPSRLDEVLARHTLRVCTTGDYKPYSFLKPDGQFEGIDIDLAGSPRQIARREGGIS